MKNNSRLNVIHCPTTVGGNPQGLAKAERDLGLNSISVTLSQNYLDYAADEVLAVGNFFQKIFFRIIYPLVLIHKYDVFHYNYGQSFYPSKLDVTLKSGPAKFLLMFYNAMMHVLELLDMKLARFFGKVVAVTFQGDDARQGDYCRANYKIHFVNEVEEGYYTQWSDDHKKDRIAIFDQYADCIYAVNPDLMNVLPSRAKFIPYASVAILDFAACYPAPEIKIPHVVHAPSNRKVKGSEYILKAFERLHDEGVNFRHTIVEGLSNKDAFKIYETADLLVDQLFAGWYGGLAVELMTLGKPVVCYIREEDLTFIPEQMKKELPIINACPDTIYQVLKEWLTDRKSELHETGRRSRRYVEEWHDSHKIAAEVIKDYQDAYTRKNGGTTS